MAYRDTIQAESNVLHYWPMDEPSSATTLAPVVGSASITLGTSTAKPTMGVTGQVDGTAMQADGVNDFASVPLDLTAYNKLVVEFWLWWDAYANDDDMAMEFSENINFVKTGFFIDPNAASGTWRAAMVANVASDCRATRPTAAAWHHFAVVFDKSVSTNEVTIYIDGVQTGAPVQNGDNTNAFGNHTLYLMSRAGSALFGAGRMQHLAIHSDLSADRILAHYNAGIAMPTLLLMRGGDLSGGLGFGGLQ